MSEIKNKISLPFKVIKSDVTGGHIDSVHTAYTGGIDLVNYHEEKYGNFENDPLQSPFTNTWVGGNSYRHVPLNLGEDTSETRQEAWHLDFNSSGVRFYSHKQKNSPPSYWSRDNLAKSSINIKNIKNKTFFSMGNYSNNYEVVQTSGRRISNNLIVDGFHADGVLTTQFLYGQGEYSLPLLDSITGSKSVIVERFSAPGNKEESTRRALDREGEEMSPNSPLPFRNIKQRKIFYKQLSELSSQTGGTIHGVNKNRLLVGGRVENDNGFISRQIPRTDIQYSWITSSTSLTAAELGGYQSFGSNIENYNRAMAYVDIPFISGSLVIGEDSNEYFVDNYGLNSLIKNFKNIDLQTNSLYFSLQTTSNENFAGFLVGEKLLTNSSFLGDGTSEIRKETTTKNKYFVLNSAYNNVRFLQIKQQYIGKIKISAFIKKSILRIYDRFGLKLEKADLNEDLVLQYSYNQIDWFTEKTVLSGKTSDSSIKFTASIEKAAPFYLRFAQISHSGGNYDNYAITDLEFVNNVEPNYGKNVSYSEITNTPYTFTSWTSIRSGETPVAKTLRKNNIISVQDEPIESTITSPVTGQRIIVKPRRSSTSTNFKDPAVTFKYKPLKQIYGFTATAGNQNSRTFEFSYSYTNNLSTFANKSLLNRLSAKEEKSQLYDVLYKHYTEPASFPENPISSLGGYKYSEILWPKEENTGISETRKRKEYILNKPGFSRDGYDIQLGTQRVFTRDEQENRKRSTNEEGGYFNSFNYSSINESSSNASFSHQQETFQILGGYEYVYISSSFSQDNGLNTGFFNSISLLESSSVEREIFSFEGEASSSVLGASSFTFNNSIKKRGYGFEIAGEFNECYIDFYEQYYDKTKNKKRSIGTLYKNSFYKGMNTSLPFSRNTSTEFATKIEDEEIFLNPKLRYVSFIGGAELNTGSYVDNSLNFTNDVDTMLFADDYFSQTFQEEDFIFSTLDLGLIKTTEQESGKKGFFDSYEEYYEDIRGMTKDMSLLSEFRISEHMEYYVKDSAGDFRAKNSALFSIDGVGNKYRSAISEKENFDFDYIKTYATSDLLKKADKIAEKHENRDLNAIKISVNGVKKLLPYNGFYPQQRSVQLANLYSEYVKNSIAGGVYNIRYGSGEIFQQEILATGQTSSPNSISIAEYNNRFYMALGYQNLNTSGQVKIYRSIGNTPKQWETTPIKTLSVTAGDIATKFGRKVKLVPTDSSLYVFVSSVKANIASTLTPANGYILASRTTNGSVWSDASAISLNNGPSYFSGSDSSFGLYFDVLYRNSAQENGVSIAVTEKISGTPDTYNVSIINGTVGGAGPVYIAFGEKQNVLQTSEPSGVEGLSLIETSNTIYKYQLFTSLNYSSLATGPNEIVVCTSPDAENWNTSVKICEAQSIDSSVTLGFNDLKAVDFENKTYLFFSEPDYEKDSLKTGGVFFIKSEIGNNWPTADANLDRETIYTGVGAQNRQLLSTINRYCIDAGVADDGKLHFGFANDLYSGNSEPAELIYGSIDDTGFYQSQDNNQLLIKNLVTGVNTITFASYKNEGYSSHFFVTDFLDGADYNIYGLTSNVFANYSLVVDNVDKQVTHAALEPIFGPGILFNTIKSGIATDWPAVTGSGVVIKPYGEGTLVNAYYPYTTEMYSHSGSNVYMSAVGSIRSSVNYRIPFENIIFPSEIFVTKDELKQNLNFKAIDVNTGDENSVTQFIKGTYIYGGYEPYTSLFDYSDINESGGSRYSVPFVYKKTKSKDTGLYSLAMSNFLAEIPKFFLKDEKMVTFTSEPDYKWKEFNTDKTYYMDIILAKDAELVMMEAYHSNKHPTGSNGEKMDGRYFGYPVNKTEKTLWAGADFTSEESKLMHNDPAYAPYTPPYFEGEARVRISFKPRSDRKFELSEIFEMSEIENIFLDVAKGAVTGSDAYLNAMPVGSSVDIFGTAQSVEVTLDETTNEQTIREMPDSQTWIISPKIETPVLDFSLQSLTPYQNDYSKTGGYGRGMWSGYGEIPRGDLGIKMRLEYPFSNINSPLTASLLEQVGFKAEERKIGQVAETKTISEAVVMIPYLEQPGDFCVSPNRTGFNFIRIDMENFKYQEANYNKNMPAVLASDFPNINENIKITSITDMIEKMKRYIIPPEFNFLEYRDIEPFVMYIMEFEHTLDRQDLSDIWQGLMPKISQIAEEETVSLTHPTGRFEFFEGNKLPENMRWLVFKVKRRAEHNYFNITATTKDDNRFEFNKIIGRKEGTDIYSYNWPYDFFSLVEFAKIQIDLDY